MANGKMKTCKHCGAEIAKSAKVCPVCGGKNKKPIFKRVWFWVLIALVLLIAVFGGTQHKLSDDAAEMSEADYKAACGSFDYKDVMRNEEDYIGKKVVVTGQVNQVVYESEEGATESQYKIATGKDDYLGYFDDDIVVYYTRGEAQKLLEEDVVTVYGEITGTETYTTVLGAQITVPVIAAAYIDIQE